MRKLLCFLFSVFSPTLVLPNFSLWLDISNSGQNILIQEVKATNRIVSSHDGEWVEIMNTSETILNLSDLCIVSKKENDGTLAPKNCFPNLSLSPGEIVIIAYSGYGFLKDNDFNLSEIQEEIRAGNELKDIFGGFLFEVSEKTDSEESEFFSENIPNLLDISKSRLYLGDNAGEVFVFNKNSGVILDSFQWSKDAGKNFSFQRPVYDFLEIDFEILPPTPFRVLPEVIKFKNQAIEKNKAIFQIERIVRGNKQISEKAFLYSDDSVLEQEFNNKDKLEFLNLTSDKDYLLRISACQNSTNFCFESEIYFRTKQSYPILRLNELYPAPNKGEKEFVEIYNPNSFSVDLDTWSLKDLANHQFFLQGIIEPKHFAVFFPNFALNNDKEKIEFLDPNNENKDMVFYNKALSGFSYSYFPDGFQWSRKITPGKENILVPQYLPMDIAQAKQIEDSVQIKGKVVIPPDVFASRYFYISQGPEAIRINTSQKIDLRKNQCLVVFGNTKKGKEPYLSLTKYFLIEDKQCLDFDFIKLDEYMLDSIALLVEIKNEIFSESGSYFIGFGNLKIKLRAPFKLSNGQARIRGVLSFGTKYFQLFILESSWVQYLSLEDQKTAGSILAENLSELDAIDQILSEWADEQTKSIKLSDFKDNRLNLEEQKQDRPNFYLFLPYYVCLGFLFGIAKMLFFT